MATRSHIAQRAYDLVLSTVNESGCDLVDVEYKKEGKAFFLRIFIDKRGGVTTDDCELVSKAVDPILDARLGVIPDYLEVSSPGLTRPLVTSADFTRHLGEEVEVNLYHSLNGIKQLTGMITDVSEESLTVSASGVDHLLPRESIAMVRRTIRF